MKKKPTLATSIYLSNVFLILVTILITCGISLYFSITLRQRGMDTTIRNASRVVADMDIVKDSLASGKPDPKLKDKLDLFLGNLEQVDVLVVCDAQSIRYYHNEPDRIGRTFTGGDQGPILENGRPYISVAEGTLGLQRRAFTAVRNKNGGIIGFVMASVLNSSLVRIRNQIILTFALTAAFLIMLGLILAAIAMYRLQRILLGYQPEEFTHLYIERSEVLNALEEGLLAINREGDVILVNQSARTMLDIPREEPAEGRPVTEIHPHTHLLNILETQKPEMNVDSSTKNLHILTSRIPIFTDNDLIGAVAIFRDKTELTKLAEELTGTKYMVDTLRAFNHEFMNKLHIILGLLEMNETEEAKRYILETSLVSGEAVSDIGRRVPISTLAALIIGKLIRASELGIRFTLKPDTYFHPKETPLPTDCFITLVGNLVENALDELDSANYPVKEIRLGIYSEENHTIITCDDTGGGIPEEVLISIYDRGTTTKGEGHGNGFALMKEIVDRYEGTFHIDTEPGEGTSIEIILPV